MNDAKLYVIRGSHACRAAMLMLEHKGVDCRLVDIPTGFQPPVVKLRGFAGTTVPALAIDGRRVQTNHDIARVLEALVPEPSLFPDEGREEVEEAERFADQVLQTTARRLVLAAGGRDIASLVDGGDSGPLGPILHQRRRPRARIMRIARRTPRFKITADSEALDLYALPGLLHRVDAWIGAGVLGGANLNAADFQIAPSLCLLSYREDLLGELEGRPAWELAERLLPASAAGGSGPRMDRARARARRAAGSRA